jgi:hypothetical protein
MVLKQIRLWVVNRVFAAISENNKGLTSSFYLLRPDPGPSANFTFETFLAVSACTATCSSPQPRATSGWYATCLVRCIIKFKTGHRTRIPPRTPFARSATLPVPGDFACRTGLRSSSRPFDSSDVLYAPAMRREDINESNVAISQAVVHSHRISFLRIYI